MSRIFNRTAVLLAAALQAACAQPAKRGPVELAVPGRTNANVTLAADGERVTAAWAATGSNGTDIYVATSLDEGATFGAPVRVNTVDGDAYAGGEQPPHVVLRGSEVDVVWVSKHDGPAAIRAAHSSDQGATFGAARTITPPGIPGARGWESAALDQDGTIHTAWLDGRNAVHADMPAMSMDHGPHHMAPEAGAPRQDIFHAMWRGSDRPIETRVASNVCFCCKTAVISRGGRVFVAWRHLFDGGVRDIAVAHSTDGGRTFSDPVRISADNWKLDACPDDGPAMAIDARADLYVVWPTLVKDPDAQRIAIFETVSHDGGVTFSPRRRIDTAQAAPSHPRIEMDPEGQTVVAWDEIAQGARRVMVRTAGAAAVAVSTGHADSYPALASARGRVIAAWTDQVDDRSSIQVLRLPGR